MSRTRGHRRPFRFPDGEPKWFSKDRYRRHVRQRSRQMLRVGKDDLFPKAYRERHGYYW